MLLGKFFRDLVLENEVWDPVSPVSYDFFPSKHAKDQAGALAFRVKSTATVSPTIIWVVVSNIFYFHPENWGRFPFLTHIFQNQLVMVQWKTHILETNTLSSTGPVDTTELLLMVQKSG